MRLFEVRRVHIEAFARDLEARGRARATIARRLCTITCFYRYAEQEGLIEHSPAVHVRRPKLDYESHAIGLDRNELGAMLVAAGLAGARDHALISLLALNGLRVSEAIGAEIEDLALERGHRTLTVLRKGGKTVTMPLAPRTARAVDLAVGERFEGTDPLRQRRRPPGPPRRRPDRAPHRQGRRDRQARSAHTRCATGSSPPPSTPASRCATSKKPPPTPTREPRCATTGPASPSTGTPPTSSPPSSPAPPAEPDPHRMTCAKRTYRAIRALAPASTQRHVQRGRTSDEPVLPAQGPASYGPQWAAGDRRSGAALWLMWASLIGRSGPCCSGRPIGPGSFSVTGTRAR